MQAYQCHWLQGRLILVLTQFDEAVVLRMQQQHLVGREWGEFMLISRAPPNSNCVLI